MMKKLSLLLATCLLLAGCVDVSVNQKLYADNTVDMSITFAGTDQVLSGFENIPFNPKIKDKASFEKQSGELRYSFSRIPAGTTLFEMEPGKETGFFGIEQYSVTKKAGFPYYTYKYSLTPGAALGNDQSPQSQAMLSNIKIQYRVETFGKVTETSGTKIDDNTVEFVLDPTSTTPYTISFRQFFLSAWFS